MSGVKSDNQLLAERYDQVSEGQFKNGLTLIEKLGVKKGHNVLDIGCGTGRLTLHAANKISPGGSVVGIDPSVQRIEVAHRKIRDAPVKNVSFEVGNSNDLDYFKNNSFDIVYLNIVLHWIQEKEDAFDQIGISKHEQVLKQGQVDVVAPLGVVVDKIEASKDVRVLFSDYDIIQDQTHCVLFTSEKFLKENPEAARHLTEGIAKAADWAKEHPKEAKELAVKVLKDKGGNPDLAKYWKGFGVRDHALLADSDAQFWIDWLVKDGKIKEGQFKPSDIYSNEFNPYYGK